MKEQTYKNVFGTRITVNGLKLENQETITVQKPTQEIKNLVIYKYLEEIN